MEDSMILNSVFYSCQKLTLEFLLRSMSAFFHSRIPSFIRQNSLTQWFLLIYIIWSKISAWFYFRIICSKVSLWSVAVIDFQLRSMSEFYDSRILSLIYVRTFYKHAGLKGFRRVILTCGILKMIISFRCWSLTSEREKQTHSITEKSVRFPPSVSVSVLFSKFEEIIFSTPNILEDVLFWDFPVDPNTDAARGLNSHSYVRYK